ncbi:SNED1 [Branchiostoma lanceolatum]|uniref:Soluble scavenger receptor cysteine-rich domain-containing protein SSC5D n=1 Tax=Branchiostoma lanceolatum TaxID=7740 RepID=A0A8J9ZF89_BRALA|nr:SNED1 [Branchiostoma lanceolatum]
MEKSCSLALLAVLLLGSAAGNGYGKLLRAGHTSSFYPFGPSAGDTANPKIDDGGSSELSISFSAGFRYFGSVYRNFWVNNNGLVSFRGQVSQFTPSPFPIQSFPTVAVFWGDVDTREAGEVYWRQTTSDQTLITRVSRDILANYPDIPSFRATWVLVTTYYDVTYYGGSPSTNRQSFQAVLATDGTFSFAIFNYGDILWTTGTASEGDRETGLGGIPAQAGFNAGDGTNYYTVPGSRSAEIVDIETRTNVGQPGTFMFRIDPFTIIPLGTVRLVGGNSEFEGRVEINRGGVWGTICDGNWGIQEAQVVCREIGHGGAVAAYGSAHYGQGSGTIWLNNVNCARNEDSISTCPLLSDVTNTCTHASNAGVQCRDLDDCRPNPCQNGGTCLDQVDDFVCLCRHPYEGKSCDVNTADPCQSGPCENGGVCSSSGGRFTCSCQPGWEGTTCQINIDECASTPCKNGGTCTDGINLYTCTCPTGWKGTECQNFTCEGRAFSKYQNPDDCKTYYECLDGFPDYVLQLCAPQYTVFSEATMKCEWPKDVEGCDITYVCSTPCENGGSCSGPDECTCSEGFGGPACHHDLSAPFSSTLTCDGSTFNPFRPTWDCTNTYHMCEPGRDTPFIFSCPADLVFNNDNMVCDWRDNVPGC